MLYLTWLYATVVFQTVCERLLKPIQHNAMASDGPLDLRKGDVSGSPASGESGGRRWPSPAPFLLTS